MLKRDSGFPVVECTALDAELPASAMLVSRAHALPGGMRRRKEPTQSREITDFPRQ